MKEIYENLFVCSQAEFNEMPIDDKTSFAFCAKDPYHKLIVGYKKNLSPDHPEYLIAKRPEVKIISANLIDVQKDGFVSDYIINEIIQFIDDELAKGQRVVLVCNQGKSRSASIGLMYMLHKGCFKGYRTFFNIMEAYKEVYPDYEPKFGMMKATERYWEECKNG